MLQTRFVALRVKWTMSVFFSLLIVWLFRSSPTAAQSFNKASGHYYQVFGHPGLSWQQARDSAISLGGHLATITTQQENAFVKVLMYNAGVKEAYFGGTDTASQGHWQWVTSEKFAYSDWAVGEPKGRGNYFAICTIEGWLDDDGLGGPYVVEWDSVVPATYPFSTSSSPKAGIHDCVSYTKTFLENGDEVRTTVGSMEVERPTDYPGEIVVRYSVIFSYTKDNGRPARDVMRKCESFRFDGMIVSNQFKGHWLASLETYNDSRNGVISSDNTPADDIEASILSDGSIQVKEAENMCYVFRRRP